MALLKIEISEEEHKILEELARENATDTETLVHAQLTYLIKTYQGKGLTPGIREHIEASIKENLNLLKRLAQ